MKNFLLVFLTILGGLTSTVFALGGLLLLIAGYTILGTILVLAGVVGLFLLIRSAKGGVSAKKAAELRLQNESLSEKVEALSRYQECADAQAEAERIRADAQVEADNIRNSAQTWADRERDSAKIISDNATEKLKTAEADATDIIQRATDESKRIIETANKRAEEIAGEAYAIKGKADEYRKTAEAYRNIIEGYGTEYLKPSYSLLDDLAEDFSFTEAGKQLKAARDNTSRMVRLGYAASCDYVEINRRETAIAFVVDAFNGKVDSILSKTKKDNYGTLEQRIKDAYLVVNNNGRAFRNAVITPEYLDARLQELKWACTVSEIKAKDQEEQRRIREQMREEERARREYERAQKEAAKEEEMLRKAMAKAEAALKLATEAEKAKYEAKLDELRTQLEEAEAKGQRALSMAQQTRRGNVYVISNIGSFGENVYKVGMTRRLDPLDRVRELGDASVPFPFDVHAIIESDDAPTLESKLHQELALMQMNKVNPRKEFFRVPLSTIKSLVDAKGLQANWTIKAEAAQYYETLAIEKDIQSNPEMRAKWEAFATNIANEELTGTDEEN